MKKISLTILIGISLCINVFAQNLPITGTILPGKTKNVIPSGINNNNLIITLKNTGLASIKFFIASSITATSSGVGVTVAAGASVNATVAQLGGTTSGDKLNATNLSTLLNATFLITPNQNTPVICVGDPNAWTDAGNADLTLCGNYNNVNIGYSGSNPARLTVLQSSNTDFAAKIENNAGGGSGVQIKAGAGHDHGSNYSILDVRDYYNVSYLQVDGFDGVTYAKEIKVTNTFPFPDYVFEKGYKLMSIKDLENFINENHHLPEVPSAKQIEEDKGFKVGEMNTTLLRKVEELTLYMIELKKENEELKKSIKKIEKRGK